MIRAGIVSVSGANEFIDARMQFFFRTNDLCKIYFGVTYVIFIQRCNN